MTSTLTMASGRRQSKLRLPSMTGCENDVFQFSSGCSGSPLIQPNDVIDFNDSTLIGDDNNNSRNASTFLSKLMDSKDHFNDIDGSPSPTCPDSDPFLPSKSGSRLNLQKLSSSQRKLNRPIIARHKPAEVFRKDLISAMKIPDTSQLLSEEYWVMQDSWRIEWEKGVQVPVNQKSLPVTSVRTLPKDIQGGFRMPRKMLKSSPEPGDKDMVDLNVLADSACRYDLDEMDVAWLNEVNEERKMMGLPALDEFSMEQIMEELETQCHDNMQVAIQTKEGLGIEYDEDVVCDVCRMPDCEEGNEMVFCDGCNLCVHQACYGILKVPEGNWLCRPCSLGIRGSAVCILCDRKGGALKSTRSGNKWAHVSCALWIPEISIADPQRMEPITKVSHVPASRWALLCSICKERVGACIQCSVKHCVTAYHVTCAVEEKLDMIADCTDDTTEDAVIFRSYCKKHSKNRKESVGSREKDEEVRRNLRQKRIMELEEEFSFLVKDEAVANALSIAVQTVQEIMPYWKLKRRANFDRPLITPKHEEDTALAEAAETNLQRRLRMFTHLRQDLERVRNLCYMIGRREKTKRVSVKNMESVFLTQMKLLERRMCNDSSFKTHKLSANMGKFGQPEVCALARRESLVLAKSPEWIPAEDAAAKKQRKNAKLDDGEKPTKSKPDPITVPSPIAAAVDEKRPAESKVLNPNQVSRHKNGLHRKAFLSACQRHEALSIKRTQPPPKTEALPLPSTPSPPPPPHQVDGKISKNTIAGARRKRSMRSNSGSERENEAKDSLLTKRTKIWPSWRTKGAGISPSAFNVKTRAADESPNTESDTNRTPRLRSTRQGSKGADDTLAAPKAEPASRQTLIADTDEYTVTKSSPRKPAKEPENHLVIKWDSDKADEPEIRTRSNKELKPINPALRNGKTKTELDNGKDTTPPPAPASPKKIQRLSSSEQHQQQQSPPQSRLEQLRKSYRSLRKQPRREAAVQAKNVPGALARSCDSENALQDEDRDSSQRQELRSQPQRLSRDREAKSDAENLSTKTRRKLAKKPAKKGGEKVDEEDGGYKGDMDESDAEETLSKRYKHAHPLGKRTLHLLQQKRSSLEFSDTADSSDGSLRDQEKSSLAKRRRLRPLHNRPETGEVRFRGYKDVLDERKSPPLDPKAANDEQPEKTTAITEEEALPKNAEAADDASDNSRLEGERPQVVGGSEIPDLTPAHPTASSEQRAPAPFDPMPAYDHGPKVDLENPYYPGIYPTYPFMQPPHPNFYYSSVYSRPGWTLTPKQESIYAQQFAAPLQRPQFAMTQMVPSIAEVASPPPLPDSTVSPESKVVFPADVAAPLDVTQKDDSADDDASQSSKKKKKKKKKRKKHKKKKKRRRRSSASSSESHSATSDEYCVEYCSTLDPPFIESTPNEHVSTKRDNNDPTTPEFSVDNAVPSRLVELSQSGNDNLDTSSTSANVSAMSPAQQPTTPVNKSPGLLLKIDRKRLMMSPSFATNDSTSSNSEPDDVGKASAPFVSPLKLKLSFQKSDRALRSGLMPCVYTILDGEQDPASSQEPSEESTPAEDLEAKPNRGQAALRRLGLLSSGKEENIRPDVPETRNAPEPVLPSPPPVNSETVPPKRKRGRPRKKPIAVLHTFDTPPPDDNQHQPAVTTSHSAAVAIPPTTVSPPPGRIRTLSDVTSADPSSPPVTSPPPGSSAMPRHWKKRKVKEHETSVTSDLKSGSEQIQQLEGASLAGSLLTQGKIVSHDLSKLPPTTSLPSSSIQVPTQDNQQVQADSVAGSEVDKPSSVQITAARPKKESPAPAIDASKSTVSPAPAKPKRKPPNDQTAPRKISGKSNSKKIEDGLPPVAPYKFTVSNTHQQNMCKTNSASTGARDKTSAINKLLARKKATRPPQLKAKATSRDDPYEFADFGS